MKRIVRHTEIWIVLIGVVIAGWVWQFRFRFPFDDTFISFRYAEHLAAGQGLVWNIGGPHTEGYTNFLFVLLLATARLISSDLLAASQLIGLGSTIASGLVIYRIASRLRSPATGMLAAAFYFLVPLTWVNALSGMETSVFVMLVVLAIYYTTRGKYFGASVAAMLATLTRPEGAMIGLLVLIVGLINLRYNSSESASTRPSFFVFRPFLLAFVLPLLIYSIWKYFYFGELLPNSFYVKVLSPSHSVLPGMQYVRLFVTSAALLMLLSLGIRGWRATPILLTTIWSIVLLMFYLFVLPLEGLYDRFLWPAYATLCITAAIGTIDFAARRKLRPFAAIGVVVLAIQFVFTMLMPRTKQALDAHEEIWDANVDHVVSALRSLPHFDSLRLAYGDAGYVVYKSGIQHLDLFGLNHTRIAHARSISERASIVNSEHPDMLLLPIYRRDSCYAWVEDAYGLARTPAFEPVASIDAFPFVLVLALDRESPFYRDCRTSITRSAQNSLNYWLPEPKLCP